jgi:hypothetical protein
MTWAQLFSNHVKDLRISSTGQIFVIDIANTIQAFRSCESAGVLLHEGEGFLGNTNFLLPIPTSMTFGKNAAGRDGIYVSNSVPPNLLYFLEFNFDTLSIQSVSVVPIRATYIFRLETAPNGDILAVDLGQSVVRFNILTEETTTVLPFAIGIVDIFDISISPECPYLFVSANDNDEVWICKDLSDSETCKPFTGSDLINPWGVDTGKSVGT